MTIEGRKHASLADVPLKDFGPKIEGFLLALENFSASFSKKYEGERGNWPKSLEKIQWSAEKEEEGKKEVSTLNWPRQILGDNQNNHKGTIQSDWS